MVVACGSTESGSVTTDATQTAAANAAVSAKVTKSAPLSTSTSASQVAQREENWNCSGSSGDFRINIAGFETSRMAGASVITTADGTFAGSNPFGGKKNVVVEVLNADGTYATDGKGDIYSIDGYEFRKGKSNSSIMAWISDESGDIIECKKI